jgi:hypothetical protein
VGIEKVKDWRPEGWDSMAILNKVLDNYPDRDDIPLTELVEAGADAMLKALLKRDTTPIIPAFPACERIGCKNTGVLRHAHPGQPEDYPYFLCDEHFYKVSPAKGATEQMMNQRYVMGKGGKIRVYPNTPAEGILKELTWSFIKQKIDNEHKCPLCNSDLKGEMGRWAVHNSCPNHGCLTGDAIGPAPNGEKTWLLNTIGLMNELNIKIDYLR